MRVKSWRLVRNRGRTGKRIVAKGWKGSVGVTGFMGQSPLSYSSG
jgi:hypothetical protein